MLVEGQRVVREPTAEGEAIYTLELFEAESRLASGLSELLSRPSAGRELGSLVDAAVKGFEARAKVELAPAQLEAVIQAASSKVLVITGGPGVGKTTIVRAVLNLFDKGGLVTRLAAPTGRAAKRLTESTGREATTLHRLLEFEPKERTFQRNEERPIEALAVIVDEASMIDTLLMDALVGALPKEARLVLVGDVDQLPSVGPGAVLRDVILSERVPTARLTTIFRQAAGSHIVETRIAFERELRRWRADLCGRVLRHRAVECRGGRRFDRRAGDPSAFPSASASTLGATCRCSHRCTAARRAPSLSTSASRPR